MFISAEDQCHDNYDMPANSMNNTVRITTTV